MRRRVDGLPRHGGDWVREHGEVAVVTHVPAALARASAWASGPLSIALINAKTGRRGRTACRCSIAAPDACPSRACWSATQISSRTSNWRQ